MIYPGKNYCEDRNPSHRSGYCHCTFTRGHHVGYHQCACGATWVKRGDTDE